MFTGESGDWTATEAWDTGTFPDGEFARAVMPESTSGDTESLTIEEGVEASAESTLIENGALVIGNEASLPLG